MNELNLVPSLLQAIVNIDGEALVMHAGDKPYVVSPAGQVDLASRGLTFDAVASIVRQLLPVEYQDALEEFGAVQYALPAHEIFPSEQFTVVVARGGNDVWAEIRRRRVPDDEVPEEFFRAEPASAPVELEALETARAAEVPEAATMGAPSGQGQGGIERLSQSTDQQEARDDGLSLPDAAQLFPHQPEGEGLLQPSSEAPSSLSVVEPPFGAPWVPYPPPAPVEEPPPVQEATRTLVGETPIAAVAWETSQLFEPGEAAGSAEHAEREEPVEVVPPTEAEPPFQETAEPAAAVPSAEAVTEGEPPMAVTAAPLPGEPAMEAEAQAAEREISAPPAEAAGGPSAPPAPPSPVPPIASLTPPTVFDEPGPVEIASVSALESEHEPISEQPPSPAAPAVVVPMSRSPIRSEAAPPGRADDTLSGLERLLRTAAARGASTLYLSSDARPSVRVDGQLQVLDGEPVHTSSDVISLLLTLMPERSHEALRTGTTTEWICDIEDIGRVRCMSFSDHRGPGGVFRLMPVRTVSVEQLGLTREVQSLAAEREGLVLVTGPRSSGKRTLMSSLVDLINRTRRDHVITIEREVNIAHERGSSLISQREVRGSDDQVLAAARTALREDPDVLVLEQIRTAQLMNVAVEAAASGHLVIGGISAHSATDSIDRILSMYGPEYASQVQLALADNLRGVVAQVLLPKIGGGRVAAREVLLNTPAVGALIAEGKTSQLPMAIEGGRRSGMAPLGDSLVRYVKEGLVEVGEAHRHVTDRASFVTLLKRHGIDTSAVERLA